MSRSTATRVARAAAFPNLFGMLAIVAPLAAASLACERRLPQTPPSAAPQADAGAWNLPPGCERSLEGHYRLKGDEAYRYQVFDDGSRVIVRLEEPEPGEPGPMRMVLERGADGLLGSIGDSALSPGGRRCPIHYPARVVRCEPGALTVRSSEALALDDDCRAQPADEPPIERILIRESTEEP